MRETRFFRSLGIYVPEMWAFRRKDSPACRELLEDVALLETAEKRILAFRGKRFERPLPPDCSESSSEPRLLSERGGSFLLFPIPGAELSLLFYLPYSAKLVSASLLALGRREFLGLRAPGGEDPQLFSLLAELLFYLDRLLFAQKNLPVWTVVLRAANFAGCKLAREELSSAELWISKEDIPLLFSLFVCFFLSVRAKGLSAKVGVEKGSPCYCVRFGALSAEKEEAELPQTPFLHCKAFRRFSFASTDETHRLLLSLRFPGAEISSGGIARYTTVFLECRKK